MNEQNNAGPLSYGADLIKAERLRQVHEEGYDSKNDDGHVHRELLCGAQAYIQSAMHHDSMVDGTTSYIMSMYWPITWSKFSFQRKGQLRDLVRAGALIAAEIDRLKRLEQKDA